MARGGSPRGSMSWTPRAARGGGRAGPAPPAPGPGPAVTAAVWARSWGRERRPGGAAAALGLAAWGPINMDHLEFSETFRYWACTPCNALANVAADTRWAPVR